MTMEPGRNRASAGGGAYALKRIVGWVALAAFFLLGVWFFFENQEQFADVSFDLGYVPGFTVSVLVLYVLRGEMQQALVTPCKVRLAWWERLGLTVIPTVANHVLPANAGFLFKFQYLQRRHDIQWTASALYLAISWVAITLSDALVVFAVLVASGLGASTLSMLYALLLAACLGMFLLPSNLPFLARFRMLAKVHEAWALFREHPRHGVRIVAVSLLMVAANAAIIWFGCRVLHVHVGIAYAALLAGVRSSSTLVNITPGSVGVTESLVAITASLIGMGAVNGVILSALIRVGILGLGLVLFVPLYYCMKKSMSAASA